MKKYGMLNEFGNELRSLEVLAKQLSSSQVPAADVFAVEKALHNLKCLILEENSDLKTKSDLKAKSDHHFWSAFLQFGVGCFRILLHQNHS